MSRHLRLIVAFVLSTTAIVAYTQEICDNGVDDDADGLIDFNDPDCTCSMISMLDIVGDFEELLCCPNTFTSPGIPGGIDCLDGPWGLASGATADFFHTCDYVGGVVLPMVPLPMPSGEGAIGFLSGSGYSEHVGLCLDGALIPGETYTVELYLGFNANSTYPSMSPFTVGVYGTTSCSNMPANTVGCLANLATWSELGSQEVSGNLGEWTQTSFTVTVTEPIEALAFGASCSMLTGTLQYHFMDNIHITGMIDMQQLDVGDIAASGGCESGITLTIPDVPGTTYQWYLDGVALPGANSNTYLVPPGQEGVYMVVADDGTICGVSPPFDLMIVTDVLVISGNVTDVACFGESTGSIDLTLPTTNPPYQIDWSNGGMGEPLTDLAPGSYTVTIVDANGCTGMQTFVVDEPASEVDGEIFVVMHPTAADPLGSALADVTGGTPPYMYLWDSGETTATATMLLPGEHFVTVTDANGCELVLSVTINEALVAVSTQQDEECFGDCNGDITLEISGGLPDYIVLWNTGEMTTSLINLCPGTYSATITDDAGTQIIEDYTITGPQAIDINGVHTEVVCTETEGWIEIEVSGGTPDYSFSWSNGETTQNIYSLTPGSYGITVTDDAGCTEEDFYLVEELPDLELNAAVTSESCGGGGDGAINLSVANGTDPMLFAWSNGATTEDLVDITSGVYDVTVTDANNCSATGSIVVSQDADIDVVSDVLEESCPGQANGAIMLTIEGGVAPFTFLWSHGPTTEDVAGLAAGDYIVTISDGGGCQTVQVVTVGALSGVEVEATITDALCWNTAEGQILLNIVNGTPPLSYLWSDGSTTQNNTTLMPGMHGVTVTDAVGCSVILEYTVNSPPMIDVMVQLTDAGCMGAATGAIDLTVNGGTPPFTFLWDNGETTEGIMDVPPGQYNVTITDANGCGVVGSYPVDVPPDITVSAVLTPAGCAGGADGAIDLSVAAGSGPYTFLWSNGATTADITNVPAGSYSVTVTDINGCTSDTAYVLDADSDIVIDAQLTQAGCDGSADGAIDISVAGGTAPFAYTWSNGATSEDLSGIAAGQYTVEVTDANGCTVMRTFDIFGSGSVDAFGKVTGILCAGDMNANIDVQVTGGEAPFSFAWSTGATTEDLSGLGAGNYFLTITDAQGCQLQAAYTVPPVPPIEVLATVTDISCYNVSDGSIALLVSGGLGAYTYAWSHGGTTGNLTGLPAGMYTVTVTDANGCIEITSYDVFEPEPLDISIVSVTPPPMPGEFGSAEVEVTGGTEPYTFLWDNGETGPSATQLETGVHEVTVTDANGCTISITLNVDPAVLTADYEINQNPCFGDCLGEITLEVFGGQPPYTISWSNGQDGLTASGLCDGTYSVVIDDSGGLQHTLTQLMMTSPPELKVSATISETTCIGFDNGSIGLDVEGGSPAYQIGWSTGAMGLLLPEIGPGQYSATVTDAENCTVTGTYEIPEIPVADLTLSARDIDCNHPTGTLYFNGSNPAEYPLLINGVQTAFADSITGLARDDYLVSYLINPVCTTGIGEVRIAELSNFTIDLFPDLAEVEAGATLEFGVDVNGTISDYTIDWSIAVSFDCIATDSAGQCITIRLVADMDQTLTVTVSDALGCTLSDDGAIRVLRERNVYIPNIFSPDGDGRNDFFRPYFNEQSVQVSSLEIFDRWGEEVFREVDKPASALTGWDGTLLEKPVLPGVYVYRVVFMFDGEVEETMIGDVTLVR